MRLRRGLPFAEPEELIRRVYSYVAYLVGDGHDAEDITADAIERALRYRSSYDPRRGSPLAWLLTIARNCVADRYREPLTVEHEIAETPDDDAPLDNIDVLTIRAAVARLGPRDRELIALRYGADLTTRQVGEQLGMRTNAVEVALHRAHARLRSVLRDDFKA